RSSSGRVRIDQSVAIAAPPLRGLRPRFSTPWSAPAGGLPHANLLKRGVKNSWLERAGCAPPPRLELSMIPRYTRPDMGATWEPRTRFKLWFEIEAHAADALAELGVIPKEAAKSIWAKGKNAVFDVARIDEIERETKHDVIAFLTHLAEIVGPEARF